MLKQLQLERLSDAHLLLFQKHIELGQEHLRTLLSQEGVRELCAEDEPSREAQKRIEPNVTEWAGALTLPFNGVLTATLGAWMGLNGFLGYFLTSKVLFLGGIVISTGLGVCIATINYRQMRRDIHRRVEERALQDIQLHIFDFLIQKRKIEVGKKTDELNELLKTFRVANEEIPPLPSTEFDSEEECLHWLEKLDCVVGKHRELDNPQIYDLFAWEITASKQKIRESLSKKPVPSRKGLPPVLEMLMRAPLRTEKKEASWLKRNWKQIFLGIIPTLYGGFSSMFVYLNGAPEIAAQLGWHSMHTFLTNPWVRMVEMTGAIGATLYFAVSFINANRKGFLRDQEIANTQQVIVQREGKLSMVSDRLSKVKETLLSLQRIEVLFVTLKKVSSLISRRA